MKKSLVFSFVVIACVLGLHGENVLLISIDTLRADRLSCYGYPFNRTPGIDRWAESGILFERAYTEVPLTLPAHSTLFTGTYPFRHGVRENVGFTLADDFRTLAEVLRDSGYTTAAFIGSYVLASRFGTGQGFETFDEDFIISGDEGVRRTSIQRPAGEVTSHFLGWLEGRKQEKFFAFVHFFDPHTPRPYGYDWEVSSVDRNIGRIHEFLEKNGLLGETHIILTSDHGEGLGEHEESGHGFFLYDTTLHVPLIIRPASSSGLQPGRTDLPASLADVMPTILDLAGLEVPPGVQGHSLLRGIQGQESEEKGVYSETYIPQLHFEWSPLRSFRAGRYKFIDAPKPELYDFVSDRGERENLFPGRRAVADQIRKQMRAFLSEHAAGTGAGISVADREALEKLAALGYVSPGRMRPREEFGAGIDPKDRIQAFESYHHILNELDGGGYSESLAEELIRLRKQAPEMRGLSFLEAQLLEEQGRNQAALESFQKAVRDDPGNLLASAGAARMLMRLERRQEAEKAFQDLLAQDPADYRSRNNLAGLYMLRGDAAAAEAELLKAVDSAPFYETGWQNLARVYMASRKWEEAEAALRRALGLNSNRAETHLLLWQVLMERGRPAEAERHRQIAVELDPRLRR